MADIDPKSVQDLTVFVQEVLNEMQGKFQNMSENIVQRIDDMGGRIDDLEKNIAELLAQAGVDETNE
ncbi:heat shock factor-binding protein 1-like [Ciona intestinalis]